MTDPIAISAAVSIRGAAPARPPDTNMGANVDAARDRPLRGPIEPLPLWGEDGFGFGDIIDIINPLQHVPIVNSIYRDAVGDEIGALPRVIGGGLIAGPLGLVAGLVDVAFMQATGGDLGENVARLARSFDLLPPEDDTIVARHPVSEHPVRRSPLAPPPDGDGVASGLEEGLSRWVAQFDPPRADHPDRARALEAAQAALAGRGAAREPGPPLALMASGAIAARTAQAPGLLVEDAAEPRAPRQATPRAEGLELAPMLEHPQAAPLTPPQRPAWRPPEPRDAAGGPQSLTPTLDAGLFDHRATTPPRAAPVDEGNMARPTPLYAPAAALPTQRQFDRKI